MAITLEQTVTESKPKRAKLNYSQVFNRLYSDPRYKHLLLEFGCEFPALLIRAWNALAEATDARILKRHIGALAYDVSVDKDRAVKILEAMIFEGFVYEDGEYFSSRFIAEKQEKVAVQRDEWAEKKRLQREGKNIPGDKSGTSEGIPKDSFRSQPQPQLIDKEEIVAVRTKALDSPEVLQALQRWERYSRERLRKPFDEITQESVFMAYAGRPKELIRDIDGCIRAGWKTLRDASDLEAKKPDYTNGSQVTTPRTESKVRGTETYKPPPEENHSPEQKAKNLALLRSLQERAA